MAIEFDGVSKLETAAPVLPASGDFTFAVWVRPNSTTGRQRVFSQAQLISGLKGRILLSNAINGAGLLRLFISASPDILIDAPAALPIGAWSLVSIVREADTFRIYIDASQQGSQASPGATILQTKLILASDEADDGLDGALAEAAVWNSALNPSEIAWLASGGAPIGLTGRLADLFFYHDLIRDTNRPGRGQQVVPGGNPTPAEHPSLRYPRQPSSHSLGRFIFPRVEQGQCGTPGAEIGIPFNTGAELGLVYPSAEAIT